MKNDFFNIIEMATMCLFHTIISIEERYNGAKRQSMRKIATPILFFLAVATALGQTNLAIGEWQSFLPYVNGKSVTQSPNKVYFGTEFSIFSIDKDDESREFLTTVEGLSNVDRSKLLYHSGQNALIVVYQNGVIDLVFENEVITINDIKNFNNIPLDKKPNALFEDSPTTFLLSTNYGISRIDIARQKVLWSTITSNNPVYDCLLFEDTYYAATENGLFRISSNQEFENFSNWTKIGASDGIDESLSGGGLTIFNDKLIAGLDSIIYALSGPLFDVVYADQDRRVVSLTSDNEDLVISMYCDDGCDSQVVTWDGSNAPVTSANGCANRVIDAIQDDLGRIWIADEWNDYRFSPNNGERCTRIKLKSVPTANVNEIAIGENMVVVASGGVNAGFQYAGRNDGYFILDSDGEWQVKSLFTESFFKDKDLKNFHRVQIHPETGDIYTGTYWAGVLVDPLDGSYTLYGKDNSTLKVVSPADGRERVTGMAFDEENNLWVSNFLVTESPISVFRADGTWKAFKPQNMGIGPNEIAVDQNGYKWITLTGDGQKGVAVFNEGEMDVDGDEQTYTFTSGNSILPNNEVICVAVDLDGDVWVGTSEGPVIFDCGSNVFDGECEGRRETFEVDSIPEYLLGTEEIRTIAIDGANRKWFGTRNGVFVLSASGEEEDFKFNTSNSPLLSNTINDIAIDPKTGTAYIGTDKGLIAYRSDAIAGGPLHESEVIAYPNPVRPGYDGPIAIKGLPRDAGVKITDITGKLVFQGEALGGQAIWDGMDYDGRAVESGVYLVFSSSNPGAFDDVEAMVTKILIVR